MFKLAIIPFFFLLAAVTADNNTSSISSLVDESSQATPAELQSIIFRFYNGSSMDSFVETSCSEPLKYWDQQNANKPMFIYVHGWGCCNNTSNNMTRTAAIGAAIRSGCWNVWEMLWEEISCNPYYPYPANSVDSIGGVYADFINAQVENGWDPMQIMSIGHSLGCHICGLGGKKTNVPIRAMKGLDCAGPGFTNGSKYQYNDSAITVHVVHTDNYFLGNSLVLGQVDLYPNKGERSQPMCDISSTPGCSHEAPCLYIGAEMDKPNSFMARTCDSWDNWNNHKCDSNPIVNIGWTVLSDANGESYLQIPDIPPGKYYYETSGESPYGLGEDGATSSTSSSSSLSSLSSGLGR